MVADNKYVLGRKRKTNGSCVGITTLCVSRSLPWPTCSVLKLERTAIDSIDEITVLLPQFSRVLVSGFSMIHLGHLGPLSVAVVLKIGIDIKAQPGG
jgi:hypothetical protein